MAYYLSKSPKQFHIPRFRKMQESEKTAFVTACDIGYMPRAQRTIHELRSRGGWNGDIVLIAIDFDPADDVMKQYNVIVHKVSHINTDNLVRQLKETPIGDTHDNRHFGKLYQWDKLYVFTEYFKQWNRIVFLDAGLRVFNTVQPLLDLEWHNKIIAYDDSGDTPHHDNGNRFKCQLRCSANPTVAEQLFQKWPRSILDEHYFLNCIFLYDTALLSQVSFDELVEAMNLYPICSCNEMTIMNLFFTFKLRCWQPMPYYTPEGKYLFGWCERNYRENPNWERFHFIKYSVTG